MEEWPAKSRGATYGLVARGTTTPASPGSGEASYLERLRLLDLDALFALRFAVLFAPCLAVLFLAVEPADFDERSPLRLEELVRLDERELLDDLPDFPAVPCRRDACGLPARR
jgi:hypothetical protein